MTSPAAPPATSSTRRDLLALAALGLLAFAAAWRFALFDRLVDVGYHLEGLPVGALVIAVIILAFGLKVYAWRRWREARRALADQLRAEATLDAREAQLGLLTRQLPAFLWTTDANLRLTTFAGGGFRRGGIDPRGRVGLTVAAFFGTDDPAFAPLTAHHRALGGDPADYPLHREGREYEVRVEPLRDAAGAIVGTLGFGVDVTARERAAAALRDSEARFRAIFEHAAIGIGLADLDRRPLIVNPALARLTGRDGAEADGHGLGRSTHPEDAARDKVLFAELVAGRRDHYQIEKRYLHPDGTTAWGRLTTSLVRDAGDAPQYAIGMVEDITARVKAEESLRVREARYRAVVEQAAEGIVLFEAGSKRIVETNPALQRLLGYTEAALSARTLYDLVAHDRASIDANVAAIVASGQDPIGERDYRRADGMTMPVEVGAVALAGEPLLLCAVVRDVTARRQAEATLRASEARLQVVVEHAPVILFALDTAGVVTFVAGRGLVALGHAPEAIVGYPLFAEGPYARTIGAYARRALVGEPVEARVAVGGLIFATHYASFHNEAGAVAGVIGVATDVTALARAEAARDEARQRLAASREAERLRLARELHDGPVQELLAVCYQLTAPGQRSDTAAIAERLLDVVTNLRGLLAELRPAGLDDFGLPSALEEYAARLTRDAAPDGPALLLDLDPPGAGLAPLVAACLFRVAQEALRNALRHAGARRIQVALRLTPREATLCVEDDGRGFVVPPRLATLVHDQHFGLVGLAERVAWVEGQLDIRSTPGMGTTITARVPRYDEGETDA